MISEFWVIVILTVFTSSFALLFYLKDQKERKEFLKKNEELRKLELQFVAELQKELDELNAKKG